MMMSSVAIWWLDLVVGLGRGMSHRLSVRFGLESSAMAGAVRLRHLFGRGIAHERDDCRLQAEGPRASRKGLG
jgi:hypothetical protein